MGKESLSQVKSRLEIYKQNAEAVSSTYSSITNKINGNRSKEVKSRLEIYKQNAEAVSSTYSSITNKINGNRSKEVKSRLEIYKQNAEAVSSTYSSITNKINGNRSKEVVFEEMTLSTSPGGTEAVVTIVDNSLYVELEEVSISHKKPVGENSKSGAVVPSSPSKTYAKPNKSIKQEKM
ncbi:hypothetical protein K1719_020604 [Acacia pycnantha]|nr:hypothetical protein K1719_020604 [Acacia pycnantha]